MRNLEALLWVVTMAWAGLALLRRWPRRAQIGACALLLALASAQLLVEGWRVHMLPTYAVAAATAPLVFPVYSYAPLDGPDAIGTSTYELRHGPAARDLVIQVWYPRAADTTSAPSPLTLGPDLLSAAYASFTGLPQPLFDSLRLVRTHAVTGAPVSRGRRAPVVLFSHGPLANRSQSVAGKRLHLRASRPAARPSGKIVVDAYPV